jgi:hypothetical protein
LSKSDFVVLKPDHHQSKCTSKNISY